MRSRTDIQIFSELAEHVQEGLSKSPKQLSSRFFYDDKGSKLFQQIMELPEYYLTSAEDEIMRTKPRQIYQQLNFETHFNLIELGPGDGSKTLHFIKYLVGLNIDFTYRPIDISSQAITDLSEILSNELPQLQVDAQVGDYLQVMDQSVSDKVPNLVLFLGSNIGNFEAESASDFLRHLANTLSPNDKLLLGVDLKKHPVMIRDAYNDRKGVTSAFNLNLLRRINKELGANFDLSRFDFYATYDPLTGDVRSFLVSMEDQVVCIKTLSENYHFRKHELISTELSKKYSLEEIEMLAASSGFEVVNHFCDESKFFTDSLWKVL